MQFSITPLPQLVHVNHRFREAGWKYHRRNPNVFVLFFCCKGIIHIAEDEVNYTMHPGEMIVLDQEKDHYGYKESEEEVEYYYIYFIHSPVVRYIADTQIDWDTFIRPAVKRDPAPPKGQYIFLPKFTSLDLQVSKPILENMYQLHRTLNLENAMKLQELLVHLLNVLHLSVRPLRNTRSFAISEKTKKYIQKNFQREIQTKELEDRLHYHYDYIARCLKQHTGMSPMQYLLYYRLNEACHLLGLDELPITEIAGEVGIRDYNYFSRQFRRAFGVSPKTYRKLNFP